VRDGPALDEKPEPGKTSVFVCDVCGKPMHFWEIEEHKRKVHNNLDEVRNKLQEETNRSTLPFVAPWLVALGCAFVLTVIFAPSWMPYSLLLFVAGAILIGAIGRNRAKGAWDEYESALGEEYRVYKYCRREVRNREMLRHMNENHPREAKRERLIAFISLGSIVAVLCAILVVILVI